MYPGNIRRGYSTLLGQIIFSKRLDIEKNVSKLNSI